MPILKENKKLYPDNWKEISKYIREKRAQNKCEFCGVKNYSFGYRDKDGKFIEVTQQQARDLEGKVKFIQIVLTVAHLDHNPQNNDYSNLKALCQKCHNAYDAQHRVETRKNKKLVGQLSLNFEL